MEPRGVGENTSQGLFEVDALLEADGELLQHGSKCSGLGRRARVFAASLCILAVVTYAFHANSHWLALAHGRTGNAISLGPWNEWGGKFADVATSGKSGPKAAQKKVGKVLSGLGSLASVAIPPPGGMIVGGVMSFVGGILGTEEPDLTNRQLLQHMQAGFAKMDVMSAKIDTLKEALDAVQATALAIYKDIQDIYKTVVLKQDELEELDAVFRVAMDRLTLAMNSTDADLFLDYVNYVAGMRDRLNALEAEVFAPSMVERMLLYNGADKTPNIHEASDGSDFNYCEAARIYKNIVASRFKLFHLLWHGAIVRNCLRSPAETKCVQIDGAAELHAEHFAADVKAYDTIMKRMKLEHLIMWTDDRLNRGRTVPKYVFRDENPIACSCWCCDRYPLANYKERVKAALGADGIGPELSPLRDTNESECNSEDGNVGDFLQFTMSQTKSGSAIHYRPAMSYDQTSDTSCSTWSAVNPGPKPVGKFRVLTNMCYVPPAATYYATEDKSKQCHMVEESNACGDGLHTTMIGIISLEQCKAKCMSIFGCIKAASQGTEGETSGECWMTENSCVKTYPAGNGVGGIIKAWRKSCKTDSGGDLAPTPMKGQFIDLGAGCCSQVKNGNELQSADLFNENIGGGIEHLAENCKKKCTEFANCQYILYGFANSDWCAVYSDSYDCTYLDSGPNDCGSGGDTGVHTYKYLSGKVEFNSWGGPYY